MKDVKHVIKVSDERQANQQFMADSRELAEYYRTTGQQLSEPELNWLDSLDTVERLARKRREAAQEARNA